MCYDVTEILNDKRALLLSFHIDAQSRHFFDGFEKNAVDKSYRQESKKRRFSTGIFFLMA